MSHEQCVDACVQHRQRRSFDTLFCEKDSLSVDRLPSSDFGLTFGEWFIDRLFLLNAENT